MSHIERLLDQLKKTLLEYFIIIASFYTDNICIMCSMFVV